MYGYSVSRAKSMQCGRTIHFNERVIKSLAICICNTILYVCTWEHGNILEG